MAPKATATGSRAAQPATLSGSAAQPATPSGSAAQPAWLPMREQKKGSPQFGAWTDESVVATDSAEHPTLQDMVTSNVASPAHETSFNTLKDMRHWLHHLSEPDQSSAPVCRVHNALRVLELQSSRDTRKQIRYLLKAWDITQKESPRNKT